MKTIKQIAVEIGVSKQAVYDKIKREPLSSALKNLTVKLDNTLHYDLDGERLIKSAFNKKNQSSVSSKTSQELDSFSQDLIDSLKGTISILERELEVKNKLIDEQQQAMRELNMTIRIQAESINAANKNELAETIIDGNQKLIDGGKFKNKINIFKIFSRKK